MEISSAEKVKIATNLMLLAPPCQFNEVFTDVRILFDDDAVLKEKVTPIFGQYNKDQFIPAKLPDKQSKVLITNHNDLGGGKFYDPKTQQNFKFDHMKRVSTDVSSAGVENSDCEDFRQAIDAKALNYTDQHYRQGTVSVFSKNKDGQNVVIICIESHYSKHFMSGRWRSEWTIPVKSTSENSDLEVHGIVKIQTHIYEEGNVQLLTSKNHNFTVKNNGKLDVLADQIMKKIEVAENEFQEAIGNNLKNMSNTTFKSLRRQLPVTKNKVDWNKINNYKVGGELYRS